MNILSFLGMTGSQVVLMSFLCAFAVIIHSFTGRLLVGEKGFFTNALAGVSFNAAVSTLLLSFAACLVKPYIYASLGFACVGAMVSMCRVVVSREQPGFSGKTAAFGVVSFLLINLLLVLLYLTSFDQSVHGTLLYNGHQNYFSGIPLEIFQADYWGRIRIFDNYPLVWSKYHFFNGALVAQVLGVLEAKNFLTFTIAKIAVIALMIVVILENCVYSDRFAKRVFLVFIVGAYVFTALSHQLLWSFFSNAFTSIAFIILALMLIQRERWSSALFFLFCFALSTSRSLIPGAALIAAMGWGDFREYRRAASAHLTWQTSLPAYLKNRYTRILPRDCLMILVFGAAILCLVLWGQNVRSPFHVSVKNFFHEGWLALMSASITTDDAAMRLFDGTILRPSPLWYAFWSIVSLYVLACDARYEEFLKQARALFDNTKLKARGSSFYLKLALFVLLLVVCVARKKIRLLAFYFIVPLFLANFLVPKKIQPYVKIFCLVSLVQVLVFSVEISIPNFAIIEWIVLYGVVGALAKLRFSSRLPLIAFLSCLLFVFVLKGVSLNPLDLFAFDKSDSSVHVLPLTVGATSLLSQKKGGLFCYGGSDVEASLAALAGSRVSYAVGKSDRYNVSQNFGRASPQDIQEITRLCPVK